MVKLIGSIIIVCSASMVGWQISKYFALRPLQLRTWLIALQMLETEILFGSTPLHRAFEKISKRVSKEIGSMLQTTAELLLSTEGLSTYDCWQRAIQQHWGKTALRKEEKDVLLQLGHVLGGSDRGDQQKHLRLAMTHLSGLVEEAKVEQGKYESMSKSLGFLGGLFVVILML